MWVLFGVFCALDVIVYIWTPSKRRSARPWWRFLPGGAIIARLFLASK